MFRNLFLFVSLMAIAAASSFAQNNTPQYQSGPNAAYRSADLELNLAGLLERDDSIATGAVRPRVVAEKPIVGMVPVLNATAAAVSAVKSSVVVNIASVERIAFEMLNQKRREAGLGPLAWNAGLAAVARQHSQSMAEYKFFGHRGLDGKMVSDRADGAGMTQWRAIGENIAFNRGYQDPISKAVENWMNSAPHKHNLLDDSWRESAVGVAIAADGSYYFTQVFLLKK